MPTIESGLDPAAKKGCKACEGTGWALIRISPSGKTKWFVCACVTVRRDRERIARGTAPSED